MIFMGMVAPWISCLTLIEETLEKKYSAEELGYTCIYVINCIINVLVKKS